MIRFLSHRTNIFLQWYEVLGKRPRLIFLAAGLVLFAFYLALSNPFSILLEVGKFHIEPFIMAVAVNNLGLLLFAFSWYIILRSMETDLKLWEAIRVTFVSFFVVWLIPIPNGSEIIRAYLISRKGNPEFGKAVASVVIHKSMYNISFGALIASSAILVLVNKREIPVNNLLILFVVVYAAASSLIFMALLSPRFLRWLHDHMPEGVMRLIAVDPKGIGEVGDRIQRFIGEIEDAVSSLKSRIVQNILALAMVALHWSSGSIATYLVALSLGQRLDVAEVFLVYAVVEFIQQLNIIIPGGVGVIDAGLTGALVLIGSPIQVASAISLLTRLVTYWLEILLSSLFSFHYGYREALRDYLPNAYG